jgi:hypothetical protein
LHVERVDLNRRHSLAAFFVSQEEKWTTSRR